MEISKSSSHKRGQRIVFVPFISKLAPLFDQGTVEVSVRLILKALSPALGISLERGRKSKRWGIGAKRRE